MLLGFVALHDLTRACSYNIKEYKDKASKCKLELYAP